MFKPGVLCHAFFVRTLTNIENFCNTFMDSIDVHHLKVTLEQRVDLQ